MGISKPKPCEITQAEIDEAIRRIDLDDRAFTLLYLQRDDVPTTTKLAVFLLREEKRKCS